MKNPDIADPLVGKEIIIDIGDPEDRARKRLAPDIHLFEKVVEGKIKQRIMHSSGRVLYLVDLAEKLVDAGRFETESLVVWPDMQGDKIWQDIKLYERSEVVVSYVPIGEEVGDRINGYGRFPSFGVGKLYLKRRAGS